LETSGGVLLTVDMVVQRRDGPRRLCDNDDDDDESRTQLSEKMLYVSATVALLCKVVQKQ